MPYDKRESALGLAMRLARGRPGVLGVDFGYCYKDGRRLSRLGIRFHVANKTPLSEIPPMHLLPTTMASFRTDVIAARYGLQASPREVCEPLQPGVSIGNAQRRTYGTLGLCVRDRFGGSRAIVSNWHVLCGSRDSLAGEAIIQPGALSLGTSEPRTAAILERWAQLDTGADAALARVTDGVGTASALFSGGITIAGVEAPQLGARLVKFGATSLFTHGMVDGIGGAYEIDYSEYGDTRRWIDGMRIVTDPGAPENEISLAGDSGSIWVNPVTGNAVALHFAGEDGLGPTAEYALAQPIGRVLQLLDADMP